MEPENLNNHQLESGFLYIILFFTEQQTWKKKRMKEMKKEKSKHDRTQRREKRDEVQKKK